MKIIIESEGSLVEIFQTETHREKRRGHSRTIEHLKGCTMYN